MKKRIGKVFAIALFLAVMGVVGKMDYSDQQFDAALSQEIRRVNTARPTPPTEYAPPLDSVCLALNSHTRHCQTPRY